MNSSLQNFALLDQKFRHKWKHILLAEAYGKGTSSSRINEADRRAAIDREIHESIDRDKNKSFDVNIPPSIDKRPEFGRRAFDLFGAKKFYGEDKDE
ncbi:hypothetical protein F2Q69_00020560 [Brassica cretica]|uniref:Uncharacterized protein n=1 Tax=Brassica cretica TaxID=69181 RepID=A0A8S9QML1_BRACR|nr:hypothetical protein F2Q69_00020560 [Brassica cretica]